MIKDLYHRYNVGLYEDLTVDYVNALNKKGINLEDCIPSLKRYEFLCGDPENFLQELGIDSSRHFTSFDEISRVADKPFGTMQGGVYRDPQKIYYFVKEAQHIENEIIGSRLLSLLAGTDVSAAVKIIEGESDLIASRMIRGFTINKQFATKGKKLVDRGKLYIAMDLLGMIDRHNFNMGYVDIGDNQHKAARIDYDHSFSFESHPKASPVYTPYSDPLNLKHLFFTVRYLHFNDVDVALNKLATIDDKEIVMNIFESRVILNKAGYPMSLKQCYDLADKLIERKKAFARLHQLAKYVIKNKKYIKYYEQNEIHIKGIASEVACIEHDVAKDSVNLWLNGQKIANLQPDTIPYNAEPFQYEAGDFIYSFHFKKLERKLGRGKIDFLFIDEVEKIKKS